MYFVVMIVDVEDMFGRMSTNSGSTPVLGLGFMVIDDDIDREVHLARGRVIDQGHGVVDRVILDLVPLDEVDPEQIDERSVLLVADVPEIDDIGFDVEMLGDRLQRRCTGDRVRIRAVLSDDRQPRRCLLDDLRELPRICTRVRPTRGRAGRIRR